MVQSIINLKTSLQNAANYSETLSQWDGVLGQISSQSYKDLFPSLERFLLSVEKDDKLVSCEEIVLAIAIGYYVLIRHIEDKEYILQQMAKLKNMYPESIALKSLEEEAISIAFK
jgi:hypothetical protein